MAIILSVAVVLLLGFIVWAARPQKAQAVTDASAELDEFVSVMEKATAALNDVHAIAAQLESGNRAARAEAAALPIVIGRQLREVVERMEILQDAVNKALAELHAAKAVHLHIAATHGRSSDAMP